MKKQKGERVLARALARRLSAKDWSSIAGRGLSFYGTGLRYPDGRHDDVEARDCSIGNDVYIDNGF